MEIISHRGYWLSNSEKNKYTAFKRAFDAGFGTETDLRDCNGEVVISHDIPEGNEITLNEMLDIYNKSGCQGTLALNIKADGLQQLIKSSLESYRIHNYFIFDSSVPDTLLSIKSKLIAFARCSEFEPQSELWDLCEGVWYDSFSAHKLDVKKIDKIISSSKFVSIVSAELHGKDPAQQWKEIKSRILQYRSWSEKLILCTDKPQHAQEFFYG